MAKERGIDLRRAARNRARGPDRRRGRRARRGGAGAGGGRRRRPPARPEVIPLTQLRKTIARRMTRGLAGAALPDRDVRRHDRRPGRAQGDGRAMREGDTKPTFSDILTKVCAVALLRHSRDERPLHGRLLLQPTANVGIRRRARQGLVVPVIQGADRSRSPSSPPTAPTSSTAPATASSSRRISRTARSRSRTSACSASSASSPC